MARRSITPATCLRNSAGPRWSAAGWAIATAWRTASTTAVPSSRVPISAWPAAAAKSGVGATLVSATAGQALVGTKLDGTAIVAAERQATSLAQPAADQRGPAEFRKHVAGVMLRRAIQRARERAA